MNFIPIEDDDKMGKKFDEIHFFGDKTFAGGNDYEIFSHNRVIGDTKTQCTSLFLSWMDISSYICISIYII